MLPDNKYKLASPINGIDVSSWQGHIDWTKVKAAGIKFAILRAGYGKYSSQKDTRFEEYYAGCKANGIPVGVYWASYATTAEDAVLEAKACLECIKGKSFELPIAYDYEAFQGTATYIDANGKPQSKQLLPEVANAVIPAFMNEMQKAGYYVSLYSYYAMLVYNIPKALSSKYDIFLAHYAASTNWNEKTVWQNSCKGRVNGINGDVDLDVCYYDYPKIIEDSKYDNATEPTAPVVTKKYLIDVNNATYNIREYPYDDNTQLTEHFNIREFRCKCGKPHPTKLNDLLVAKLEKIRAAIPGCTGINPTSGYRCVQHDINVGGSGRGQHTVGNAVDYIAYDANRNVVSTKKLCCMAQDVGMTGIANINKTYTAIHNDVRPNGVWHGNEIYGNNYCVPNNDFYSYFGLTKEDVYGKDPTPTPTPDPEPVNPDPTPEPTPTPGTTLTAGTEVKLNNTTLYGSSTAKTGSKRSGTYYIYSDEVINGRIRITTPKSNVGKTPVGSYVTGWVNTADIQGTTITTPVVQEPVVTQPIKPVEPEKPVVTEPEPEKPATNTLTAGMEVNLKSTPLYASAGAKRMSSKKTGKFYIYSDEVVSGRIRITNSKTNVGKKPVGTYVTGWANVSDLV